MSYAIKDGGVWRELVPGEQIVIKNIATSYASMLAWSSQYRTAQGIKAIDEMETPEGKISIRSSLIEVNGRPYREHVLADAPPPPVPEEISDRQFAHALALQNVITESEALDFVRTGTVPAELQGYIDEIESPQERFAAQILVSGAVTFRRDSPFTALVLAKKKWTAEQGDDFWRFASTL